MEKLALMEICGADSALVGAKLRPILGRFLGGDFSSELFEEAGLLCSVANNLFEEELQPLFEAGSLATLAAMNQQAHGGARWHELRCLRALLMACHKGKDAYAPGEVDKAEELFFAAKHSEHPLDQRAEKSCRLLTDGASDDDVRAALCELAGLYYGLKKEAAYRQWMIEKFAWCVRQNLSKTLAPAFINFAVHTEGSYALETVRNLTGVKFLPTWMQSWYLHQASDELLAELKTVGLHPDASALTVDVFQVLCELRSIS